MNGVLILAGGKSERMFFPKPFLLYEGETFLKRIINQFYNAEIKNIFVVLNKHFCHDKWDKHIEEVRSKITLIENPNPELGRLHSIKLGLKNMMHLEYCFIQNIDNPFVSKETIRSIMSARNPLGYTAPVFDGISGHPILISKKIIQYINALPEGNYNLREILSHFPKQEAPVHTDEVMANINTPEDYSAYITKKVCR